MSMEQKLYRQAGLDRAVEILEEMAEDAQRRAEQCRGKFDALADCWSSRVGGLREAVARIREEG